MSTHDSFQLSLVILNYIEEGIFAVAEECKDSTILENYICLIKFMLYSMYCWNRNTRLFS